MYVYRGGLIGIINAKPRYSLVRKYAAKCDVNLNLSNKLSSE